jgi:hypothetical protein
MLKKHGLLKKLEALNNLRLTDPLGYLDFVKLKACAHRFWGYPGGDNGSWGAMS